MVAVSWPSLRCSHCGHDVLPDAGWLAAVRIQIHDEAPTSATRELGKENDDLRISLRQRDDHIGRMNAQLGKVQRGSAGAWRQEEGLARQDLFGEQLRDRFPEDQITISGRGVRGTDVRHVVRSGGMARGVMLWECKRAAQWSGKWAVKLAREVREAKAMLGIIVSDELPRGIEGSGRIGDLWVCEYSHASHLAAALRETAITASRHQAAASAGPGIPGKVYDYITSGEFALRLKAILAPADSLRQALDTERRTTTRRWQLQERAIEELRDEGVRGIVHDLNRLAGDIPPAALAELAELDDGPGELALPGALALAEPVMADAPSA